MHVFIFYLSSGNGVATYRETATHSVTICFLSTLYKYLIVNLVFRNSVFGMGISL